MTLLILLSVRERTQNEGEELRDWCCSSESREFDVAVVTGRPVGDWQSVFGRAEGPKEFSSTEGHMGSGTGLGTGL